MDDTDQTPVGAAIAPAETGSTSSTPQAESPPADSVTALGERILTELGAERTNNTLTRWLAHHTARLIEAADKAKTANSPDAEARGAEARGAILQLWNARSDWPSGWPPPQAAEMAMILEDLPSLESDDWYRRTVPARLHDIHHHVLAVISDLAAGDASVNIEQSWLAMYGDQLTEDETTMLRRAAGKPRRLDALLHWNDLHKILDVHVDKGEQDPDATTKSIETHPLIKLADAYRDAVVSMLQPSGATSPIVDESIPGHEG